MAGLRITETAEAIQQATSRIAMDTRRRDQMHEDRRCEPRLIMQQAIRVTPLGDDEDVLTGKANGSITAFIRDISSRGVGVLHAYPFKTRRVLMHFSLLDGAKIAVIVQLAWTSSLGDFGCASGGEIVAVVEPQPSAAVQVDSTIPSSLLAQAAGAVCAGGQ